MLIFVCSSLALVSGSFLLYFFSKIYSFLFIFTEVAPL